MTMVATSASQKGSSTLTVADTKQNHRVSEKITSRAGESGSIATPGILQARQQYLTMHSLLCGKEPCLVLRIMKALDLPECYQLPPPTMVSRFSDLFLNIIFSTAVDTHNRTPVKSERTALVCWGLKGLMK